jgi:putative ABC transport system substrate-binding protein
MRRREFIAVAGGAVGWPLPLSAISPSAAQTRKPRLAMLLVAASETSPEVGERREALAELGWIDGRTIDMVTRYAEGDLGRVPALMAELVALNPDVILTHTGVAARRRARSRS